MPKRAREPEEDELDVVVKRVCQLDAIVPSNKRPAEHEEYTPNKRQRQVGPTIHHKASEYRECIRKLYNMNKRLLAKLEMAKHQQKYTEAAHPLAGLAKLQSSCRLDASLSFFIYRYLTDCKLVFGY